ncbi:MAG: amidohydrolase family protein, partial [Proteobacteria bacterium]|nr:amidohydrolase family protein [Pseudomonadota bacterium]
AEARNGGLTVTCDQYPYQAASTFLHAALPPGILAHGDRVFTEILRDPNARTELIRQIENSSEKGWENLIRGAGFEGIYIATAGKHEHYVGRSVADIAETEDKNPYDVVFDLLAEEERGVVAIFFMINEDDIVEVMRSPLTMIGSDGIPGFGVEKTHPRQTGTFPRILGRYVREKGILDLEEAVRKMTSLPAQTFGLKRKGLLKEGFDADLVVFDPETVLDRATYEDPNQAPVGIDTVLVNGRMAVEKGKVAGADSGKVLRRGSENRIVSRP